MMKQKIITLLLFINLCFATLSAQSWQPVGTGTDNKVNVICQYGADLYAGGTFTIAGGQLASYIAKWNGTSWTPLPMNVDGIVEDMVVYNGELYVTGSFAHAGVVTVNSIAKWDGTSWSAVGGGIVFVSGLADGYALAVHDSALYLGGWFTDAGGVSAASIAKWDGSNWTALGLGINGFVHNLESYNGELYAGGNFFDASGVGSTANLAKWNGTSWLPVSSGVNGIVRALHTYNNELYIGGQFTTAGGVPVNRITKWNGTNFSAFGLGIISSNSIETITDYNGNIYVGGSFSAIGGMNCKKVAKWDGTAWSPLGAGLSSTVYTLLSYNGDLYAGGTFDDPTSSSSGYDHMARWTSAITNIEITNGIDEENELLTYPNPVNEVLNIEWTTANQEDFQLKLVNIAGIVVLDIAISGSAQKTTLDVSDLSTGVYFLNVEKDKKSMTYKFIKK